MGLRLLFFPNVPEATFIQGATSTLDSRVPGTFQLQSLLESSVPHIHMKWPLLNKLNFSWTDHPHHILGTVPFSTTISECTSTACYILWMGARLSNTMCITIEGHVQGVPDWYYTAYFFSTKITWILCKTLFACNSGSNFLLSLRIIQFSCTACTGFHHIYYRVFL